MLFANNAGDCMQNAKSLKKSRRRWEVKFKGIANIFLNQKEKLIFLPNTEIREQISEDYMKLQKQHEKQMLESDRTKNLVQEATVTACSEVSQLQNNMSWPPKVSGLNLDMVRIPNLLQRFLSHLFCGSSQPSLKTTSIGQDIIYCVHNGQFITSKHILLPVSIKSMAGNVELIKIINRLGHGVPYTKLSEVDPTYAIQKIATNLGLIPEEI